MQKKCGCRARAARPILLAAGFLALSMSAQSAVAASATDARVWAKAGVTAAEASAALEGCKAEAATVNARILETGQFVDVGGGSQVGGLVGALVGKSIDQAFMSGPFRPAAQRRCMWRHGYAHLRLTPEEAAAQTQQGPAWTDHFLAGADIGGRVAAALAAHPPAAAEPVAEAHWSPLDELIFEPSSIVVTGSVTGIHKNFLTVRVRHAQTGRLAGDFTLRSGPLLTLSAGSAFYRTERATAESMRETVWCGPTTISNALGHRVAAICIWEDDEGPAAMFDGEGQPWMVGQFNSIGALYRGPSTGELRITPTAEDSVGPMELTLRLDTPGKEYPVVSATVSRDGKAMKIWGAAPPWDASGHAVVPFAGGQLKLTRLSTWTVTAEFTPGAEPAAGGHGG